MRVLGCAGGLLLFPFAALAAGDDAPGPGGFRPDVIYGADDRVDYYAAPAAWRKLADSTVAVFKGDKVGPDGSLVLESFAERHRLCTTERFADQPSGPYCSGSLVAPDIVMTAGHCLYLPTDRTRDTDVPECDNMKFVFGYAFRSPGAAPKRVDPGEVYRCAGVLARVFPGTGSRAGDYALIRLDRPVNGHPPLALDRAGTVSPGDGVAVIGTPSGLPVKIAAGATVRDASDPWFFVADLDSFGGNSGSAVFNEKTKLVEGIVVRGETDFRPSPSGDCNVYNVKPQNGGRGEDVVKISRILPSLDAAAKRGLGAGLEGVEPRIRAVETSLDGRR